jgi:hypothetical protein
MTGFSGANNARTMTALKAIILQLFLRAIDVFGALK